MSYWDKLKSSILGSQKIVTSSYFGGKKKYEADQSDKSYFYEKGFSLSSDLYSIVNRISKDSASIPTKIFEIKNKEKIEITNGDLFDIVRKPNDYQNEMQFRESLMLNLLLSGEFFIKKNKPFGIDKPFSTDFLNPQFVKIETELKGTTIVPKSFEYNIDGKTFKDLQHIAHIKYANPTDYGIKNLRGLSPLVAGYLSLIGVVNNQTASASIMDNQGASGIISNESDYILNEPQQKIQQQLLDEKVAGASKFGKIIQSLSKVKYTKLGLDPAQLKIIESKIVNLRDLCNIYNVPSVVFNDSANRIESNLTSANTQYWTSVVNYTNFYLKAYNEKIVSDFNKSERKEYIVELDTSQILALQKDKSTESEINKKNLEGINTIVEMLISDEGKIKLLMDTYKMDEESAKLIVL